MGGEEFAVLLPKTALNQAAQLGERLRRGIAEHTHFIHGIEVNCTISIGVAMYRSRQRHRRLLAQSGYGVVQREAKGSKSG
ncbi:MAG: diguanylate cyclase [Proteobacteria bacterium]|nr:diguanylate cyclase [Pseudomonadota bacterium]